MAPCPMPPSPMPEPIAASPIPTGSPRPSAAWKPIVMPPCLVRVLRVALVPVGFVRQHEEDVDRAEDHEHHGLERAGEQRQYQERQLERKPDGQVRPRQCGDTE